MDVISKKFGTARALWFRNSRSFLLLEEPAFDVFRLQGEGRSRSEIVGFCRQKYGHIEKRVEQFVDEISALLEQYRNSNPLSDLSKKHLFDDRLSPETIVGRVAYKIGNRKIRIQYGHPNLYHAIHPLQAHLVTEDSEFIDHEIEVFTSGEYLICKYNGKLVEAFQNDKVEYFTGNVRQLMYSIVYGKDFLEWMCMLHASGIEHNRQSVLFSAAAGSGKTTISALLKARGYGYLSDDFIAADALGKAYSFPAAISVKEGSVPVLSASYPGLLQTPAEQTFIGKSVRYIPVTEPNEPNENGFPVKAFVFVQYSKEEPFVFEPVEKKQALQLLLKETWVNPQEKYVKSFFEWVEQTPFYRLQYAETQQALAAVKQIYGE